MNTQSSPLPVKAYNHLIKFGSYLQSPALLLIRLAWGWELWTSGSSHLHNVATMAGTFKDWGVPFPTLSVYVSGTTEAVGGILLMLGLFTRGIALPLIFHFIVAYLTASRQNVLAVFSSPQHLDALVKLIDDTAFPFLVTSILMLAFGPGNISL